MEPPLLTLKPSVFNALFPLFLKYALITSVPALLLYGLYRLLHLFGLITLAPAAVVSALVVLVIAAALAPLLVKTIILANTRYSFYRTHIVREFSFLVVRRISVPYTHIVNLKTDISIWDRLSRSGDIILHTAEEQSPELVLQFVKHPRRVEQAIHELIRGGQSVPGRGPVSP